MSLYDRLASKPEGARALAKSRLVRELDKAFTGASRGRTVEDTDLTRRARRQIRRRLRFWPSVIAAAAEYLHAYGYELTVELVPAGQPRADVLAKREAARSERNGAE